MIDDPEQYLQQTLTCAHEALRYPRPLTETPGTIVTCPDCRVSYRRPGWMDRFTPRELKALQVYGQIIALWIDYTDPDHAERRLSQRTAYQELVSLMTIYQLTPEYLVDILHRLEEFCP